MDALEIENFLKQLDDFYVQICADDGNFRHLYAFSRSCSAAHFHVITWPHQLVFVTAHSNYVFRGIDDMFSFFRRRALHLVGLEAFAEAAEKRSIGVYEYSPNIAKNEIESIFKELIEKNPSMSDLLLFDKAKIVEVVECEKWLIRRIEQFREMYPQLDNETAELGNTIFQDYSQDFLAAILSIGMAIKSYDGLKSSNKNNTDA